MYKHTNTYRCAPVFTGNTFQDLSRLRETADNAERYVRVSYINTVKFNKLALSEHRQCDNAATNANSESARSSMEASSAGRREYGAKEDQSSTGRIWAAGFHHVMARSRLERVLKITNRLFH
jgi:hypothetical protein